MKITNKIGTILPDTTFQDNTPVAIDVRQAPIRLISPLQSFSRLPDEVVEKRATGNKWLPIEAKKSSGIRIRFKTDSDYIAIHADYTQNNKEYYMPMLATSGFDLYTVEDGKHIFKGPFIPYGRENKPYTEAIIWVGKGMKDIIINFPLMSHLENVYVILREGSEIEEGGKYAHEKPVVFYGSSIVHGYGASRPSMSYPAQISRALDTNFLNFGFGGSAFAEPEIIKHIASYDMSVFVYDYDHNAPTVEYLEKSHYNGYLAFREIQPKTPIIMASRPWYDSSATRSETEKRLSIIKQTYLQAKAAKDDNIYLINGSQFFPSGISQSCSTDCTHPNDLGYHFMSEAFGNVIKNII